MTTHLTAQKGKQQGRAVATKEKRVTAPRTAGKKKEEPPLCIEESRRRGQRGRQEKREDGPTPLVRGGEGKRRGGRPVLGLHADRAKKKMDHSQAVRPEREEQKKETSSP